MTQKEIQDRTRDIAAAWQGLLASGVPIGITDFLAVREAAVRELRLLGEADAPPVCVTEARREKIPEGKKERAKTEKTEAPAAALPEEAPAPLSDFEILRGIKDEWN